jgi:glycerol uptake facilitator-like aquaporin
MILFVGKISGTQMNPAVALGFATRGDFLWRQVRGYLIAQIGAGFLAAFGLVSVVMGTASGPSGHTSLVHYRVHLLETAAKSHRLVGKVNWARSREIPQVTMWHGTRL